MSAYNEAGDYGLVAKIGKELKGLHRFGRGDLLADPSGDAGIRGIVDQLLISEAHVGDGNAIIFCDTSGDPIATFNSSGAHNIGVSGQVVTFAGGIVVTDDLVVNGTTFTVNSQTVLIDDNILFVNSGPSGSRNAGYAVERYQAANNLGSGDVVNDSAALVATVADIGDQTGQDGTHIYLGAGASAVDDYYTGLWAKSAVSDNSNVRKIIDYNGTTKIATVATAWDTQPSSNTQVQIYTPFQAFMFDEASNVWRVVSLLADDTIVDDVPVTFGDVSADGVTSSVGFIGPYIKSSGGDFTVAGGNGMGGILLKTNGTTGTLKLDIDHTGGLTVYDNVQPDTDSAYNFGSSTAAWATGYFDTVTSLTANDRLKLGTDAQVLLSLPVFTTQQITDNIAAPAEGDLVYDSTTHALKYRSDSTWVSLSASGASSLDDAYNNGSAITVDNGAVALTQAKTTENAGTLTIGYAASAFTGTSHAIAVDLSGASSFNNAGDIYGVKLVGKANAGAGNSVGLRIASFDVGIENVNSLNQDGAADFSGGLTNSSGELLVSGGNVQLNDDIVLSFGSDDDVSISFVSGSSLLDVNVTGAVELDASGAIAIESSGGAISIGADDVDQAVNLATDGERTVTVGSLNGAASLILRAGTGGLSWIESGLSNSATNAPAAANDVVFLNSDGLSKADAAAFATAFVMGSYTNTAGQVKKGKVTFSKIATNAGGTTFDDVAKGDLIWLAAAIADEYDAGVTPVKGRVSNRAPVAQTAGTVNMIVGKAYAASGTGTSTVVVDFSPQYVSSN